MKNFFKDYNILLIFFFQILVFKENSLSNNTDEIIFEDLIKSKIEPISNSNELEVKHENKQLKQKILQLEERCAALEDKVI